MTYILLNLAATLAFIFFTFYIDKKLSIEASEQNAFSITMLTATIESVIYFFVLLFKNMWLSSLVTPLMKIIFALEGILFVNFSFALLSMATDTKKFLVKLVKYTLCVLAIYIAWWQFKTIDISNDKGIVIASNFLFEEPARNFFPWDWVFVFNAVFKFIIPIFALLFVNTLIASVRRIIEFQEQFQRGMTGIDRFYEIMDTPVEIVDDEDAEVLENVVGKGEFID